MERSATLEDLRVRTEQMRDAAQQLRKSRPTLEASTAELLSARMKAMDGRLERARSPLEREAYTRLSSSDARFAQASAGLKAAIDLERSFEADSPRTPPDGAHGVERVNAILQLAEVHSSLVIGGAELFQDELLIGLHDTNARYLGREAWKRAKAQQAAWTIFEGALDVAKDHGIELLAAAVGIAAGPIAIAVTGTATAIRLLIDATKKHAAEIDRQLDVLSDELHKLYVIESANAHLALLADYLGNLLTEAAMGAAQLRVLIDDAARSVRESPRAASER